MSAAEIIEQIQKLPEPERKEIFRFVDEVMRAEEDRVDNETADRALAEGEFVPWEEVKARIGLE